MPPEASPTTPNLFLGAHVHDAYSICAHVHVQYICTCMYVTVTVRTNLTHVHYNHFMLSCTQGFRIVHIGGNAGSSYNKEITEMYKIYQKHRLSILKGQYHHDQIRLSTGHGIGVLHVVYLR